MKTRFTLVLCLLAPLMLATGCDDDGPGGGGGDNGGAGGGGGDNGGAGGGGGDNGGGGGQTASFGDIFNADANADPVDFDAGGVDFSGFGEPNDDASDDNDFL